MPKKWFPEQRNAAQDNLSPEIGYLLTSAKDKLTEDNIRVVGETEPEAITADGSVASEF